MCLCRVLSVLVSLGLVLRSAADRNPWEALMSEFTSSGTTLKEANCSRVLDDVSMCVCGNQCYANLHCLGVAYSPSLRQCRISPQQPTLSNTGSAGDQPWLLAHRRAPGMANENCRRSTDCYGVKGPASCRRGKCGCAYGFRLRFDMCQSVAGDDVPLFGEMSTGVPDPGSLLVSVPRTPPGECEQKCLATPTCLILSTSSAAGANCSLFSRLKSYSDGANTVSKSVRARQLPYPEGEPSDQFLAIEAGPAGRRFAFTNQLLMHSEAVRHCAELDSVLYPAESPGDILAVFSLLNITAASLPQDNRLSRRAVFLGIDVIFDAGNADQATYVSSNGKVVTEMNWNNCEPSGLDNEHCTYVNVPAGYRLHDIGCHDQATSVCEYLGSAVAAAWQQYGHTMTADLGAVYGHTMTADLGAVYDVKEVRYTGAVGAAPGRVSVFVSVVPGEVKQCAVVAAARGGRLICTSPSYGRYVHLHHNSISIDGNPAVYGTWLYGL